MYEQPVLDLSFKTAADLSAYQYMFVKLSSGTVIAACGANERSVGILQNKPDASGKEAVVRVAGVSQLKVNEAIAVGKMITSTSGSLGEVADAASEWVGAIALEAATAQNDRIAVLLAGFDAYESDA